MRVGFVGAGFIATFHSKLLRVSGVTHERAGVFDPDASRAEAFVAAAGGFVAGSEAEVLASCDAVFICTWTSDHEAQVRRAVDAGVAVFIEKPLSTDLAGARRVTELLAGTTHQVGLVLRRSPAFGLVESILEERDRTGRVMSAVFRDDQVLPTGGRYASAWRAEVDKAGSGVLLEHSIHDLDVLDRLLGPVTSVSGHQRSFHGIDGIEDLVVATFELRGRGRRDPDDGVARPARPQQPAVPRDPLRARLHQRRRGLVRTGPPDHGRHHAGVVRGRPHGRVRAAGDPDGAARG